MRRFFLLLASTAILMPAPASAQPPRRNIVVIVADDLGLELGCYGNKIIRTPNIDGLAKKGVRFTRAYATVSSCSPSRASILTGLYSHQNGQYGLQHPPHSQQTHPWVQSLPNLLRGVGYRTGLIGKFHLGPNSVYNFDAVVTKDINRDVRGMADKARAFIGDSEKRPFFLYYALHDPHRAAKGFGNEPLAKDTEEVRYDPHKVVVPYHLPDTLEVRRDLADYYQAVSRLDRGVGLLLAVLRETGQLDDTLIIFISDNGIPFPGAKTTLYSAGIQLPLIVVAPEGPRDRANNTLVSFVDLAPTVLDFAKAKGPAYKLPGRSLLPILGSDKATGWDSVFASHQFHEITMSYPMRALVTDRYKYIVNLSADLEFPLAQDIWDSPSWQDIRAREDKMLGKRSVAAFLRRPREELYDLNADPDELRNLAADPAQVETLANLRGRVRAWQRETRDPWAVLDREEKASNR